MSSITGNQNPTKLVGMGFYKVNNSQKEIILKETCINQKQQRKRLGIFFHTETCLISITGYLLAQSSVLNLKFFSSNYSTISIKLVSYKCTIIFIIVL